MPGTATTEGSHGHKAVHDLARSPLRTDTTVAASLPESRRYRIKRVLLGPPLVSDDLHGQRLGKPTALAVLSSDVMSSSAYATEEILRILVPIAGLAAFSIVTPMTGGHPRPACRHHRSVTATSSAPIPRRVAPTS